MKAKAIEKPITDTDQDLTGVEIFKAGTYQVTNRAGEKQAVSYTAEDVAQLAENGNALLDGHHFEAPAKLGHSEKQSTLTEAGLPAAGWVTRLYSEGSKLLADFKQVPAKLAEAIRRGRYKYVSSEIYDPEDTERNFGEFGIKGFTLRAVAFLGADIPVVKGLNPLMLAAGEDGARIITIQVEAKHMANKFGESEPDKDDKDKKPLMVHANRHPYGALVKHADDKEAIPHVVHAIHPDGTYDTHPLHGDGIGKEKKAVGHDNLTLLSEGEYKTITEMKDMDATKLAEMEKTAAADKAALLAEKAKVKELLTAQRDEKINAFAEKFKEYGLTAALKPSFEAVAKMEVSAPVKLAEGKELPYVDAILAFAEGLISTKKIITGEITPATPATEEPKDGAVKLAELPFQKYAEANGMEIQGADLAVKAREYAEKNNVPFKTALMAVAALGSK